jgi:hypothetical protein
MITPTITPTPYQRENTRLTNHTFAAVIRASGGNPANLSALSAATRAAVYRYQHGLAPFRELRNAVTYGQTTERDAAQTIAAEIMTKFETVSTH